MSDRNAWMPLYVGDYLADTMHLTGPEHGAYLLLLMHAWRCGPLPQDERKLAAIARTDLKAWREISETILAFFTQTDAGLVQGRLERIRGEQGAKVEQRRAAGKASAEARKAQRNGQRDANDRSTTVEAPLPSRATEPESEEEREDNPPPTSLGRPPRGSRLPSGWSPDADLRKFASGLGLNPDRIAAQFRDYWHAKAGKDAVKLDWSATWRGWCRREAERVERFGKPAQTREALHDTIADIMRDPMRPVGTPATRFDFEGEAEHG